VIYLLLASQGLQSSESQFDEKERRVREEACVYMFAFTLICHKIQMIFKFSQHLSLPAVNENVEPHFLHYISAGRHVYVQKLQF